MSTVLHMYWFKLNLKNDQPHPHGVLLGCGITAYDYSDALNILKTVVFDGFDLPEFEVIEDMNLATLEPNHVRPNIGNPVLRGIWYPQGYFL